jgi:hypothetical protein
MDHAPHPLRVAVEARDPDAIRACFAPGAVLRGPFSMQPFVGRDAAVAALAAFGSTLEDLRYTEELPAGEAHVLVFRARLGDQELEGVDVLYDDPGGAGITNFLLTFRPLDALGALAAAVVPKLDATPGA